MSKVKEDRVPDQIGLLDFKDSPYYDKYLNILKEHNIKILNTVMLSNDNSVLFTWNDVLKQVFAIINNDLVPFADSIDVNPNREALSNENYVKSMNETVRNLMGSTVEELEQDMS